MKKVLCLLCMILFVCSVSIAAAKTIELKVATWEPPDCPPAKDHQRPWADEIEKRTAAIGQPVKITFYYGGALGKPENNYDLCLNGTSDMSLIAQSWTPGVFPLSDVVGLPMLYPSGEVASGVFYDLAQKYMLDKEYKKVKVLWLNTGGAYQLFTRTKQVKTLEDLKGMKLASNSPMLTKIIKRLGGTPVFLPEPDIYTSLEKGLIDGRWIEWEGAFIWKSHEVTKYRTGNINLTTSNCGVIMNMKTWNSLSPEIQKIFEETTDVRMSMNGGKVHDDAGVALLGLIKEYDKKVGNPAVYYLPEAERERWRKAVAPVYDEWIKEMNSRGFPGQAIVDDARALAQKYSGK